MKGESIAILLGFPEMVFSKCRQARWLRLTMIVFILTITIIGQMGCGFYTKYDPMALLPASTVCAVMLDWRQISKDLYLKRLIKGEQIESYARLIDLKDGQISNLTIFSNHVNGKFAEGVIVSGSFRVNTVLAHLKDSGWEKESHHGSTVYVNRSLQLWFAPVSSTQFVIGMQMAVDEIVKSWSGRSKPFLDHPDVARLNKSFARITRPITMYLTVPQNFKDAEYATQEVSSVMFKYAHIGFVGELLQKIGIARALGCSISHQNDFFSAQLFAIMEEESSAQFISGSINLIKGLGSIAPQSVKTQTNGGALSLVQRISASSDRDLLTVRLEMPLSIEYQ